MGLFQITSAVTGCGVPSTNQIIYRRHMTSTNQIAQMSEVPICKNVVTSHITCEIQLLLQFIAEFGNGSDQTPDHGLVDHTHSQACCITYVAIAQLNSTSVAEPLHAPKYLA